MTPIDKIERLAMSSIKPPPGSQCGKVLAKIKKEREGFVETVVKNVMVDGLVIPCKR